MCAIARFSVPGKEEDLPISERPAESEIERLDFFKIKGLALDAWKTVAKSIAVLGISFW